MTTATLNPETIGEKLGITFGDSVLSLEVNTGGGRQIITAVTKSGNVRVSPNPENPSLSANSALKIFARKTLG